MKPFLSRTGKRYHPGSLLLLAGVLLFQFQLSAQTFNTISSYMKIGAVAGDPLLTTYSASSPRTVFPGAVSYKAEFSDSSLISYKGSATGRLSSIWKIDDRVYCETGQFFRKPVVTFSFPDMMIMEYMPARGVQVRETFFVYSGSLSMADLEVTNTDKSVHEVSLYPVLGFGDDSVEIVRYCRESDGILSIHLNRKAETGFSPFGGNAGNTRNADFFSTFPGSISHHYNHEISGYCNDIAIDTEFSGEMTDTVKQESGFARSIMLQMKKVIRPGEVFSFRYLRGTAVPVADSALLMQEITKLKRCFLKTFFEDNLMLFSRTPRINFYKQQEKLIYLSGLNLSRVCFYPAAGNLHFNFWASTSEDVPDSVLMRHLVNESPGLAGCVYADPGSAENAFRLIMGSADEKKQQDNELLLRSDPAFNWTGMEIYKVTRNKKFLQDVYNTGKSYYRQLLRNTQNSGSMNAWRTYLVSNEAKSLAWIARELGKTAESVDLLHKADKPAEIDSVMISGAGDDLFRNYLIWKNLKQSGREDEARLITEKMKSQAEGKLRRYHEFRKYSSPPADPANYVTSYFPDCLVVKWLIEENVKPSTY